jgi:alpha-tubulin suppressor-like RCC1 family protein
LGKAICLIGISLGFLFACPGDGLANPASRGADSGLRVESISVGAAHACGILPSQRAVCWGENHDGQLGTGDRKDSKVPVPVKGLGRVRSIEASSDFTCAIKVSSRVMCWGNNYDSILGPKLDRSSTPVAIKRLKGVKQLSSSPINICALNFNGRVYCWGDKAGFGNKSGVRPWPVRVPGARGATSIAVGTYSSCAVKRNHQVVCWSNPEFRLRPKRNLGRVRTLNIDLESGCALRVTNRLVCWGDNFEGFLGVGKPPDYSAKPLRIPGLGKIRTFSADGSSACAVRFSGRILCWGANDGSVGDGTRRTRFRPVLLSGLAGVRTVSVNEGSVCATTHSREGYCWGYNSNGQLGDRTRTDRLRPTKVVRSFTR